MKPKLSRRNFIQTLTAIGSAGAVVASSSCQDSSKPVSTPQVASINTADLASSPLPYSTMSSSSINPRKVLLWEQTRKEVREALQRGDIKAAIVPTGSTEQHNEHLVLGTDVASATLLSEQTALRLYPQVIVSTPCPVGWAPYHMARKGTLTLSKETFRSFVFEVIESLIAHGIKTILVCNGHGGNHHILKQALPEWRKKLGITLDAISYSEAYKDEELATFLTSYKLRLEGKYDNIAEQTADSHASEHETSIALAAYPQRVRSVSMKEYDDAKLNYESGMTPKVWEYMKPFDSQRTTNPENARDRARQDQALLGTAEKGKKLIEISATYLSDKLQKMIHATEKGLPWPTST